MDEFRNCETDARLDGKVALITGATSGLGLEVAKNLSRRGAKLIIASRNPSKLENARKEIIEQSGNDVVTRTVDYESLASVRRLAHDTIATESRLDILINNVGAIGLENKLTEDNLEMMMQVNYFGMFLLTYLLFPLLRSSAPSRIINVSSFTLLLGQIDIDHINDIDRFTNFELYCNAKLAAVLFTVEMNKRIQGSDVQIFSMDPGVLNTDFFRNMGDGFMKTIFTTGMAVFGRSVERVASVPVFLASDPSVKYFSGGHFKDCLRYPSSWHGYDDGLTMRLWNESKWLVGIKPEEDWEKCGFYKECY